MIRSVLVLLLLMSVALSASGQDSIVSEAVVPVVGTVTGLEGVEWRCDVAVRNDTGFDVDIAMLLLGAPGEPFFFTSLPAGQTMIFHDIARQTFGLAGFLSPLVVRTLGPKSVTVAATAYGVKEEGVTRPQVLSVIYDRRVPVFQSLPALSVNETFRTNIGLVNLGDEPAFVEMALQRVAGHNIATASVTVPATTLVQLPLESFFPLLTSGENLSVIIQHPGTSSYAYASVIANDSHDARFYGAR